MTQMVVIVGGYDGDRVRVMGIVRIGTKASHECPTAPSVAADPRIQCTELGLPKRFADNFRFEVVVI
jgi:hypothetical protein